MALIDQPLADLARIRQVPGLRVVPGGYEGITYQLTVEINHRRKELADPRVRRAIAHAIDRRFVVDIETNETSRMIVRSLVALCEGIGVECIVEGVETEGQARALGSLGCSTAQGYLYARPVAVEGIPDLLDQFAPDRALSA